MVKHRETPHPLTDEETDRLFRALADATRRDIIRRTLSEQVTISALAADYDMSFTAVHKHVTVLEGAGLVTKNSRGRERFIQGNPDAIARAQGLLTQFEHIWRGRIQRLDALFEQD